jgi:FAD/FMN-containing dehydrogenase
LGAATQAFNLTVRQELALVAPPCGRQDVIAIVEFARAQGMQVTAERTGHNAEPLGALDDVVLVKTDALQGVEVDVERRIARVRSGAKWATSSRSHPSTASPRCTVDPGRQRRRLLARRRLGWYARKLGLSTNSVTAIELVTADGALRRVDPRLRARPLLGAARRRRRLRNVTAVEVQLYSIPDIYAGVLFFPWERSSEVLHAWREWTETVRRR